MVVDCSVSSMVRRLLGRLLRESSRDAFKKDQERGNVRQLLPCELRSRHTINASIECMVEVCESCRVKVENQGESEEIV